MSLVTEINNLLSGGLLEDALDRLANSSQVIENISVPDLNKLIPQLTLQVQQGTMTPAQASAAFVNMQGSMSPAMAKAAFAQIQSFMTPAQANAVYAVMQGKMEPAKATAFLQQDSEMRNVQSDQASIQGQREALANLSEIAKNKGLTEADRAQFAALMNQANAEAARNRAAQIQQLQMQGNAGSGAELAARLAGTQSTANSNAAAGAQLAQSAQARALQALQLGLAGNANLNTQLFDQAAKKAQAQDIVNQFNAQARNTIGLQNAQMQQQAGLANFNTANQFALANQTAAQQAAMLNAQNQQQAALTNTQNINQFALQNAANQQAANLANAGYQQQANQQNFQTANQIAIQNAANQQAANLQNAGYQQQANQANFNMANTIGATNTGILNQQATLPYNAAQANFTNQMNRANAISTANANAANVLGNLAGRQAESTVNAMNGLLSNPAVRGAAGAVGRWVWNAAKGAWDWITSGSGGGTIDYPYDPGSNPADPNLDSNPDVNGNVGDTGNWWDDWFSDERLKTDKSQLSDRDVDLMMGNLTGYKYRYKGAKTNPTQAGVMAQDMPKDSVIDTPAGKMIQGPQALNEALAILANQHDRILKLEGKK